MKKLYWILIPLLSLVTPNTYANNTENKGLNIAIEMDRRDSGFQDYQVALAMVLRNGHGEESRREIRFRALEVEGDGDKSLSIFDYPADVSGTAFLSHTHASRPDDQWLYLPALKRVKRISSANKSGPFMGSEFAYEDLTSQEVEKYTYNYLREDKINGRDCAVIERSPTYMNSGYSRQEVWVDREYFQPVRIKFYDRKGELLKTLSSSGYRQYQQRYWRPSSMNMVNHQTGKETLLVWNDYVFASGLSARDFDRNSLKRAR